MLHCEGEQIINSEGKKVALRGTNLGGWLLDELWQGFFKGGEAQWDILTTLERRFGKNEADRLIKIREDNYITEYDLDYLQSLGFTCVRVPFWYRNFYSDDIGTKILDGRPVNEEEFEFRLINAINGEQIGDTVKNIKDGGKDIFKFPQVTIPEAGIYHYKLTEIIGEEKGVSYDTASYHVVLEVIQDDDGILHIKDDTSTTDIRG